MAPSSGLCPPHRSASGNGQKVIVCEIALFSVTAARVWTRTDRSPGGWERKEGEEGAGGLGMYGSLIPRGSFPTSLGQRLLHPDF